MEYLLWTFLNISEGRGKSWWTCYMDFHKLIRESESYWRVFITDQREEELMVELLWTFTNRSEGGRNVGELVTDFHI